MNQTMNSQKLTIQVLVENTVTDKGLLSEHGLSYLIKTKDRSLLFDTGQGMVLAHNASALGVDLKQVDTIILSHGHYDHTGGLCFFRQNDFPKVYIHPNALHKKFAKDKQGHYYPVGITAELENDLEWVKERAVWTEQPTQIMDGIWVTGVVPRVHEQEKSSYPFYLDDHGLQLDELTDDQSIYIQTAHGVVVVLGCAHSGVVNTLDYIKKLTGGRTICFVIGGMHLLHASSDQICWDYSGIASIGYCENLTLSLYRSKCMSSVEETISEAVV